MNTIKSNALDSIIKRIEDINKNLSNMSVSLNKNMVIFNKGLQTSNKTMLSMKKTSGAILTNFRLATLAVAAMAAGKAKDVINKYGGAGASFRAASNKSSKVNDIALDRAFKLSTGDEQKGLQETLGRFASRGTVTGSKEQQLLLQSGIDPKAFAGMNQIERFNKLMEMYSKRGNDINFLEQIEELTGMDKGELDALNKQLSNINKQYIQQSKNLKNIDMSGFENINTLWDETMFFIQDSIARLFNFLPSITKEFEPFINALKSIYTYLTNSLSYSESMSNFTRLLSNLWNIVKKLASALGEILGPVIEWVGEILSPISKFLADITEPSAINSFIDSFKTAFKFISLLVDQITATFHILFDLFKLMFENIKLGIFKVLDWVPGVNYSKEIDESNRNIAEYRANMSENYKKSANNAREIYNMFTGGDNQNNIQINVNTNDVSRINNTSARVISK